ncbi:MAG: flippase-like domain-containing protein [Bacillaceae bacterium]
MIIIKYRILLKYGKIILPITVMLYVLYRAKAELNDVSLKKSIQVLHELTPMQFLFFISLGLLAVSIMSLYDIALTKSLHLPVRKRKVFQIGFIANAFNGVLGFGGIAGAGLRTMLYREYTKDTKMLVKGIAWMTTAVANGLSFFSICVLIHIFKVGPLIYEKVWLLPILIIFSCILPTYIIFNYFIGLKNKRAFTPSMKTKLGNYRVTTIFTVISIGEWLSAAFVLYLLLWQFEIHVPFLVAMGVFTLSAIAGFISFVPGGLGSFDLAYLLGMSFFGYSEEHILSILLLYRLVYYFIPFGIALVLSVFEFGGPTLKWMEDKPIIGPVIEATRVIWAVYREFLSKSGRWALAVLIGYTGWVTILAVWAPPLRQGLFDTIIPHDLMNLFYHLTFVCGIILILNIRGIYYRTKRSYFFVFPTLCASIILHLVKALDYKEAIICGVVLCMLVFVRHQFKRESIVLTLFNYMRGLIVTLILIGCYYIAGAGITSVATKGPYTIRTATEVTQTTLFALIVVPILVLIGLIIFDKLYPFHIGEKMDEKKLNKFLTTYGGNALSHLAFLGDKRLFLSSDGRALLQFAVKGKRVIVLGDPIGDENSFRIVLREFMCHANRYGYLLLFYQINQKYMYLYHDYGYNYFKLGEEAIVSLDNFTISGKRK